MTAKHNSELEIIDKEYTKFRLSLERWNEHTYSKMESPEERDNRLMKGALKENQNPNWKIK